MDKRLLLPAALLLLLAPALAQGAAAQRPTFPSSYLRAELTAETGFVEVPREDSRTIGLTLNDRSGDSEGGEGFPHQYRLKAEILTPGTTGWSVAAFPPGGWVTSGESVQGRLQITADPVIQERSVTIQVTAELAGQDARETSTTVPVQARVAPYHQAQVDVLGTLDRLEPQEAQVLQLEVRNEAPYPDTYDLDLEAPPGWTVHAPDQVSIQSQGTQRVDATVIAPHEDNRFYYRESGVIRLSMSSAQDPNAVVLDETVHPARVEGAYVPPYTLPFLPLAVLLAGAFVHRRRRGFRRSRKEKGPPRDPDLSAKREALLAELKERDPERYQRLKEKLRRERERREELYPEHKEAQRESLLEEDDGRGEGS